MARSKASDKATNSYIYIYLLYLSSFFFVLPFLFNAITPLALTDQSLWQLSISHKNLRLIIGAEGTRQAGGTGGKVATNIQKSSNGDPDSRRKYSG